MLPFPLPPCRARYSIKAIDNYTCGLDSLFTDDNTMGGWKRRVAKDRHAWPEKGFVADAPRPYDQQGNDRGKLSTNPYDPDSTSNPYGRGLRIEGR